MAAHEEGIWRRYMEKVYGRSMGAGYNVKDFMLKKGRRSLAIWFFINHFIHILL